MITLRVIGIQYVTPLKVPRLEKSGKSLLKDAILYSQETVFDDAETHSTPRYDRSQLRDGHVLSGPAIVVQHNSTILIPPSYTATVGEFGNLIIEHNH